jgi:hypothetical protein
LCLCRSRSRNGGETFTGCEQSVSSLTQQGRRLQVCSPQDFSLPRLKPVDI